MTPVNPVDSAKNRRKTRKEILILRWVNYLSALAAVGPIFLTNVKEMLPTHYYGALSSIFFTLNAILLWHQKVEESKGIAAREAREALAREMADRQDAAEKR